MSVNSWETQDILWHSDVHIDPISVNPWESQDILRHPDFKYPYVHVHMNRDQWLLSPNTSSDTLMYQLICTGISVNSRSIKIS